MNDTNPLSILHIEDSDADAKLIGIVLKQASVTVSELSRAKTLQEGLEALVQNDVDVILLDLYLPDSEGLDTLRRLRNHCPDKAIIVVTGSGEEAMGLQAVKSGAQDYLVKDDLNTSLVSRAIRYSVERHAYDQHVIELANIDLLTGLPNRARFMEYLESALSAAGRMKNNLSLLFIDCDNFKRINDTYGHVKGDEFLVHIAQTLRRVIRSSDFAARLGGDEFVVAYQCDANHEGSPLTLGEKIISELKGSVILSREEMLDGRCSIGVTSYNGVGIIPSADRLIYEADAAMYLSKERGGNCVSFFDQELEKRANRRVELLQQIHLAQVSQEFFINYQPIVKNGSGEIIGLEALMRWRNVHGEMISPAEFIPLLEETNAIQEVGLWIIRQSLKDFEDLIENNYLPKDAWISLNVSPLQLHSPDFVRQIAHLVHGTLIEPSQMHFEITESLLMEKSDFILKSLMQIKTIGCNWSIDDFGVGYSSMSYLKDLPIDTLKIDKSFIDSLGENKRDLEIVKAITALAHNIGMEVVCEGVETTAQYNYLTKTKCEFLQGFLFYKPMTLGELKKVCKSDSKTAISKKAI